MIWAKMSLNYSLEIKTRLKSLATRIQNRALLAVAEAKTSSRLLMRNIAIFQCYLPAIPYFKKS